MATLLPPIDDDVFAALQAMAEPLVDDINSVLRRLLGLSASGPATNGTTPDPTPEVVAAVAGAIASPAPPRRASNGNSAAAAATPRKATKAKKAGKKTKSPRAARGSLLPESEYELPMLRYIAGAGGRAPASEVVDAIGAELVDRLKPADLEKLASGDIRWRSRVQFVRLKLIREGTMVKQSPRGIWEITDEGRARANGAEA